MKTFATLINALDSTNKTNQKLAAINNFLSEATDSDKVWLLALFTGKKPKRTINTNFLKEWAMELTQIPEWLFVECYSSVGDLGETIALLLPERAQHDSDKTLTAWMEEIKQMATFSDQKKKDYVLQAWANLTTTERFIFNKLIGGSFRIGVSNKMLINALAQHYNLDATAVAHSIMGEWKVGEIQFEPLVTGTYTDTKKSQPYPFCLAYPIEQEVEQLGNPKDWQIEYKWDGIRGQIIKGNGEVFIWSRGEELVTAQFPELTEAVATWTDDFVIDGEILAFSEQQIQPFSTLQQRLNRKTLTKKMLQEIPVVLYAYDILEYNGTDLRAKSLSERRQTLETLVNKNYRIMLSEIVIANDWDTYKTIRATSRDIQSEGLMIKHRNSTYHAGRKRGDWWKWKVDPMTIDAVLIYAQKVVVAEVDTIPIIPLR